MRFRLQAGKSGWGPQGYFGKWSHECETNRGVGGFKHKVESDFTDVRHQQPHS